MSSVQVSRYEDNATVSLRISRIDAVVENESGNFTVSMANGATYNVTKGTGTYLVETLLKVPDRPMFTAF